MLPQLADLRPDVRGRLDHAVRKLDNAYFDTPSAGLRVVFPGSRCDIGWGLKNKLAVGRGPAARLVPEVQSGWRRNTCRPRWRQRSPGYLAGESLGPVLAKIVTTKPAVAEAYEYRR